MIAIEHATQAFERWDTLAWKYYGDPLAYGRIIAANPALDIGATLPTGARVLIPVLPENEVNATLPEEDLPPWKR
jgi:phage tail protein X